MPDGDAFVPLVGASLYTFRGGDTDRTARHAAPRASRSPALANASVLRANRPTVASFFWFFAESQHPTILDRVGHDLRWRMGPRTRSRVGISRTAHKTKPLR